MENLIAWFEGLGPVMSALLATLFTWAMTAAGAALVFPFKSVNRRLFDGMLGFTGGVMVAASLGLGALSSSSSSEQARETSICLVKEI